MPDTTPTLRDRVVQALAAELMPRHGGPQHRTPGGLPLTATAEEVALHRAQPLADAVLAVLPASVPAAPADRATVLREAATAARIEGQRLAAEMSGDAGYGARAAAKVISGLADEARRTEPATTATEEPQP